VLEIVNKDGRGWIYILGIELTGINSNNLCVIRDRPSEMIPKNLELSY
jgi:hypothetical protein